MKQLIDQVHMDVGALIIEIARMRKIMHLPLPMTERDHYLVGVKFSVHQLEESLAALVTEINMEVSK